MTRILLASSVAVIALGFSFGAMAQIVNPGSANPGDDSATIQQANETGSYASQYQPGNSGNVAIITQQGGTNDSAIQDQYSNGPAVAGLQQINQGVLGSNTSAQASQIDNSNGSSQIINQDYNGPNPNYPNQPTSATQTINAVYGGTFVGAANIQSATQYSNIGTTISQTIGLTSDNSSTANGNSQSANQSDQTASSITQVIDGDTGSGNTQTAIQSSNGSNNVIAQQTRNSAYGNLQTATQSGYGSNSQISQVADLGSFGNIQSATQTDMNSGLIVQYQTGVSYDQQYAAQSSGTNNQIGQYQSIQGAFASVTQSGGSNNLAIQNQGGTYFSNNGGSLGFVGH